MCSTPGLPSPGAPITLRVSFVDVHPEVIPVQLWGLVGDRREEYVRLGHNIQAATAAVAARTRAMPAASPGELCLVQLGPRWHRCRVVSRQAQECRVFLLDEGRTVTVNSAALAPGRNEFFHLPSEVLGCLLTGLVPLGGSGGGEPQQWSRGAVDFLGHLQGKEVQGRVQDVLLPQRLVLLDVPSVFQQMQDLGLARQVPDSLFRSLLKRYINAAGASVLLPRALPKQDPPQLLDYFYPQLQLGVTEPVVVTQVCHPHRIHCQLRSLSQEIRRLSDSMAHAYRAAGTGDESGRSSGWEEREESPDKPGSPCAAFGLDGQWYRAQLLENFRPQRCAQVLHVDYGRKELVSCGSLRYLLPEYFRMPVVTYPCALYGLWDGGRGWSRSQVGDLKALILGQAVNAKIEFYSSFEHVYYVTLYGEDGINLNCAFGVQSCCLADRLLQSPSLEEEEGKEESEPEEGLENDRSPPILKTVRLKANSFYDAQVEFVKDPSEFWIRLRKHSCPFGKLVRSMCNFYSSRKLEGLALQPVPDHLCCAKWKEHGYYRAVVTRLVGDKSVEVHLVDRGNTETVGCCDVKMLLPQFQQLPAVALKCCLADIWPLGESWSREAVSYFKKTVLHKELVIHVLDKQDGQYVIEILDESRMGEENVSKLIAQAGYAKYQEFEMMDVRPPAHPQEQIPNQPSTDCNQVSPARNIGVGQWRKSSDKPPVSEVVTDRTIVTISSLSESVVQSTGNTRNMPIYSPLVQNYLEIEQDSPCKGQLEVGSTVEVNVSYVESPGYFWCQLTRNLQGLRTLMCKIQDFCKDSATPYQGISAACLAKRTINGKWSRALIISGTSSADRAQVIFVDYGNKEVVSMKNIYSINDEFLKLKAQAFRCSLYNLIQPAGQNPFIWDERAIQAFKEFVDNTWEDNLELKCTIFALAAINDNELFNVVDLLTPFQSACCYLTEIGFARQVRLQKPLASSMRLHSYYYSTHDIKIGSEEAVFVTHVDGPWTFYCQLARSSGVLEQLSRDICRFSKVLQHSKTSSLSPGILCLAKYSDQNWYRGIVTSKEPNKVFFVDFGNVHVVTDEDLLPIPGDAYDLLLLPMQAVKCSLSDVYDNTPKEIASWFEEAVLDKSLKALVVAKDADGRLIIELYDGGVQINAKINEKLGLLGYKGPKKVENEELLSSAETLKEGKSENRKLLAGYSSKTANTLCTLEIQGESCKPKISLACKELKNLQSSTRMGLLTNYQESVGSQNYHMSHPPDQIGDKPSAQVNLERNKDLSLKFCDLPKKSIVPGFKTKIYVSHINDLTDFYIQLADDEDELASISEKLNDNKVRHEGLAGQPLEKGDLICAVFPEDDLRYRAVVKEQSGDLITVQFIDYGNTSVVNISKLSKLQKVNTLVPGMSIHCTLGGLHILPIKNQRQELYFSERTGEAQINCEFVMKSEDKWDVLLTDEQGVISEDMMSKFICSAKSQVETSAQINTDPGKTNFKLLNWYLPEVSKIKVYATVIDGPEYFWCQFADTKILDRLDPQVQAAGERAAVCADCISVIQSGVVCIVKYSEDGRFYRGLVTDVLEGDLVSVRFVDFGNAVNFGRRALWSIPGDLLNINMQCFPCCLSGYNVLGGICSFEENDYFYEMATEGVLELTILEVKKDVCDIPLAVVQLKYKGENLNEKMLKFSNQFFKTDKEFPKTLCENKLREADTPMPLSLDVGNKPNKVVQDGLLCVEPQEDIFRVSSGLNHVETKPSPVSDSEAITAFVPAVGQPSKDNTGDRVECSLAEKVKFDSDKNLITGLETLLPGIETKEMLELNSLEVPLSLEESKEFLELESTELQLPLAGEEAKELAQEPAMAQLSQGRDSKVTLEQFTIQFSNDSKSEQVELESPIVALSLDKENHPFSKVSQKSQENLCPEDPGEPNHLKPFSRCKIHSKIEATHNLYKEVFTEYKNRLSVESLTHLLPEEEIKAEENHGSTLTDHASAQIENTYTLEGFTIGSKCVVWSSLRNTWSECQILEIADEGTKVLNLSNGMEEIVNPENVWNGIPKLNNSPSEGVYQALEKDFYLSSTDDTAIKGFTPLVLEKQSGGDLNMEP
ncbi:tudor domain-containing protein 6 isoform X2 [Trichosurus vulpecula]|uniref:tudor domain-containing protein 6 isoform X2 n=1 Tax=Trichosurus vulpecula TaxID=9337 RepID=UPI00186B4D7C|nr:tudor domain-containing protein 6 isoform X2 [Trichosurus vulpecula]